MAAAKAMDNNSNKHYYGNGTGNDTLISPYFWPEEEDTHMDSVTRSLGEMEIHPGNDSKSINNNNTNPVSDNYKVKDECPLSSPTNEKCDSVNDKCLSVEMMSDSLKELSISKLIGNIDDQELTEHLSKSENKIYHDSSGMPPNSHNVLPYRMDNVNDTYITMPTTLSTASCNFEDYVFAAESTDSVYGKYDSGNIRNLLAEIDQSVPEIIDYQNTGSYSSNSVMTTIVVSASRDCAGQGESPVYLKPDILGDNFVTGAVYSSSSSAMMSANTIYNNDNNNGNDNNSNCNDIGTIARFLQNEADRFEAIKNKQEKKLISKLPKPTDLELSLAENKSLGIKHDTTLKSSSSLFTNSQLEKGIGSTTCIPTLPQINTTLPHTSLFSGLTSEHTMPGKKQLGNDGQLVYKKHNKHKMSKRLKHKSTGPSRVSKSIMSQNGRKQNCRGRPPNSERNTSNGIKRLLPIQPKVTQSASTAATIIVIPITTKNINTGKLPTVPFSPMLNPVSVDDNTAVKVLNTLNQDSVQIPTSKVNNGEFNAASTLPNEPLNAAFTLPIEPVNSASTLLPNEPFNAASTLRNEPLTIPTTIDDVLNQPGTIPKYNDALLNGPLLKTNNAPLNETFSQPKNNDAIPNVMHTHPESNYSLLNTPHAQPTASDAMLNIPFTLPKPNNTVYNGLFSQPNTSYMIFNGSNTLPKTNDGLQNVIHTHSKSNYAVLNGPYAQSRTNDAIPNVMNTLPISNDELLNTPHTKPRTSDAVLNGPIKVHKPNHVILSGPSLLHKPTNIVYNGPLKLPETNTAHFLQVTQTQPSSRVQQRISEQKDLLDDKELRLARCQVAKIPLDKLKHQDADGDTLLTIGILKDGFMFRALILRMEQERILAEFINRSNNKKQSPLSLAVATNKPDLLSLLIEKGADPNKTCGSGGKHGYRKPLHIAACNGRQFIPVLKVLLSAGNIDVNALNSDQKTPLQCAVERHGHLRSDGKRVVDNKETIQILMEHGAEKAPEVTLL